MNSFLCILIAASFCLVDSTVLKIIKDTVGSGGFEFGIGGGGWGDGIIGSTASRGGLGGELTFGYTAGGLKTPFVPHVNGDQSKDKEQVENQQNGQGPSGYPLHGHGLVLQGHGSYSLQGQGGFPIKYGIPYRGVDYRLSGIGGFSGHGGKVVGIVPQGSYIPQTPQTGYQSSNIPQNPQVGHPSQGGHIPQNPQTGYPSQSGFTPENPQAGNPSQGSPIPQNPQMGYPSQGGYIPQNPQAGYPSQAGYIPQNPPAGYPSQGGYIPQNPPAGYPSQGGYIPQNPQAGYPSQGGYIPQNPQTGYPSQGGYIPQVPQAGYPPRPLDAAKPHPGQGYGGGTQPNDQLDQPADIDPRNRGQDLSTKKPTLQGRRRTLGPEENPQTTEESNTTVPPSESDEESLDENTIPEDKD